MKIGDKFVSKKTKRTAVVVGVNDSLVEYRYETLVSSESKGLRKTKPNTACVLRSVFEEGFKAAS